ncbi:phage tail protein [Clostridium sp. KNHs216]|uniref:phage tail protein n=1 Tax=Clostridium sp. KNHs216 TaxID=1550235 RepID=UPI00117186EC|nr:phage tail protein [Clostridium sp. KNHs216]TQI66727.1 GpU protein [Clostridium sp. KNHs216]
MIVGTFGNKIFEVSSSKILTPRDISVSGELNVSTEDTSGKKPTTTIKGPGLEKVGLELRVLATAGNSAQTEIDSWKALRDAAVAYPLVLFGKAVSLNKFLLTNCSASDYVVIKIAGAASIAAATLKLEFSEYVPPGAQKSTAASKAASAAGLSAAAVKNPYKVPTTAQKASQKRENERMSGP